MSSLSNQQFNTKTMTGISDTYSDNIICDTIEVINDFTVDNGAVITLPNNSLQDAYLSSNVALLNRTLQTFTGANKFNLSSTQALGTNFNLEAPTGGTISRLNQSTTGLIISNNDVSQNITLRTRTAANVLTIGFQCQNGNTAFMQGDLLNRITITGATTPTISTQAPSGSNDLSIANTAWINTKLTDYATLAGTQTFTGVNTFDNNVIIRLYNFDITNSLGTRGIRFANNGANNGVTDITGVGVSTRFNFNTTDSSGVSTQNLWMGLGNSVVIQGASGLGINLTGSTIDLAGVCSFTNTTTPTITQTISTTDNSTKIATTAWVNLQAYLTSSALSNYMTLNTVQTATATKSFDTVNMNQLNIPSTSPVITIYNTGNIEQTSATISNQLYNTTINASTGSQLTIKGVANTAGSTISQLASTLLISAITNNTGATLTTITLATRSSVNGGVVILTGNANNITIGSNTTNTNISSTNLVMNSVASFTNVTTPTITQTIATADNSTKIPTTAWIRLQGYSLLAPTTQTFTGDNNFPTQLTTDNSTLVATTAYVKNQGYLIASALTPYALLTPSASPQVFTGHQRFTSSGSNLPVSVTSSTAGIVGGGGLYIASAAGQYNPIVKANDCVMLGIGGAIDSANSKITITTYASASVGIQMDIGNMTFDGGIIRQNSPFNCGYSYLATPGTIKGFYDIGYVWTIPYASFTGGAWATSSVVYNILTLAWDGTGNKRLGVWKVDVVIINTCTSAPSSSLCWNTVSNVSRTINDTCVGASDLFLFGATGCQIMRMSFTINVVNLTTTYYLNSLTGGGAGLASNTASQITFTRIA